MTSHLSKTYDPVQFMVIDDDDVSIKSIQRSLKKLNIANPLTIAKDGVEALDLLRKMVDANGQLLPCIITLDLSMPRMGGIEFLDIIRQDPLFRKLVVFVLTSSDAPTDIEAAYDKNIAGYIIKDHPTESLHQALTMLNGYSQLVVLPT